MITIGSSLSIEWTDSDDDSDAKISLYYKSSNSGDCTTGGVQIVTDLSEDSSTDSFAFSTSGVPDGFYYICAVIADEENSASAFSDRFIVYPAGVCTWVGDLSTAWNTAANWIGCSGFPGGLPDSTAQILLLAGAANEPLVSSNTTVHSLAIGRGGGNLTIDSARTLTLSGNAIKSSVRVQGSSTTCSDCRLAASSATLTIAENATLTMASGSKVTAANSSKISVGTATSTGHLVVGNGSANASEWPLFGEASSGFMGIEVRGPAGSPSSISFHGARMNDVSGSYPAINLVDNYAVKRFDHVYLRTKNGTQNAGVATVKISSCANGTFDDTVWDDVEFNVLPSVGGYVVDASHASCSTLPAITINGFGRGFLSTLENDPHGRITMNLPIACQWIGVTDDDWAKASNWSSCDGSVPTSTKWVAIDGAAPHQPTVASSLSIRGFESGADGGTVTINPGATLVSTRYVYSDVVFQGGTTTCTTCTVSMTGGVAVLRDATMTLGRGITVVATQGGWAYVGDTYQAGHLKTLAASGNSAEWPKITGSFWHGIYVRGTATKKSELSLNGIKLVELRGSGSGNASIELANYYDLQKLDNVRMSSWNNQSYSEVGYIRFSNCANGLLTTEWSNLDFIQPITGTAKNVVAGGCDLASIGGTAITITGATGVGAGAAYEDDPNGIIDPW